VVPAPVLLLQFCGSSSGTCCKSWHFTPFGLKFYIHISIWIDNVAMKNILQSFFNALAIEKDFKCSSGLSPCPPPIQLYCKLFLCRELGSGLEPHLHMAPAP
jgi:hypothetical protein